MCLKRAKVAEMEEAIKSHRYTRAVSGFVRRLFMFGECSIYVPLVKVCPNICMNFSSHNRHLIECIYGLQSSYKFYFNYVRILPDVADFVNPLLS